MEIKLYEVTDINIDNKFNIQVFDYNHIDEVYKLLQQSLPKIKIYYLRYTIFEDTNDIIIDYGSYNNFIGIQFENIIELKKFMEDRSKIDEYTNYK